MELPFVNIEHDSYILLYFLYYFQHATIDTDNNREILTFCGEDWCPLARNSEGGRTSACPHSARGLLYAYDCVKEHTLYSDSDRHTQQTHTS